MMAKETTLEIGDTVKVKDDFIDPECDLSAADNSSTAYKFIDLYRTWFANR